MSLTHLRSLYTKVYSYGERQQKSTSHIMFTHGNMHANTYAYYKHIYTVPPKKARLCVCFERRLKYTAMFHGHRLSKHHSTFLID